MKKSDETKNINPFWFRNIDLSHCYFHKESIFSKTFKINYSWLIE